MRMPRPPRVPPHTPRPPAPPRARERTRPRLHRGLEGRRGGGALPPRERPAPGGRGQVVRRQLGLDVRARWDARLKRGRGGRAPVVARTAAVRRRHVRVLVGEGDGAREGLGAGLARRRPRGNHGRELLRVRLGGQAGPRRGGRHWGWGGCLAVGCVAGVGAAAARVVRVRTRTRHGAPVGPWLLVPAMWCAPVAPAGGCTSSRERWGGAAHGRSRGRDGGVCECRLGCLWNGSDALVSERAAGA